MTLIIIRYGIILTCTILKHVGIADDDRSSCFIVTLLDNNRMRMVEVRRDFIGKLDGLE